MRTNHNSLPTYSSLAASAILSGVRFFVVCYVGSLSLIKGMFVFKIVDLNLWPEILIEEKRVLIVGFVLIISKAHENKSQQFTNLFVPSSIRHS